MGSLGKRIWVNVQSKMTDAEHNSDTETEVTPNNQLEDVPPQDPKPDEELDPAPEEEPDEICVECNKPITVATVKFQDMSYHPECFVCSECGESLCGKLIYKVEGKRIDKECYTKKYARKCGACGEPLVDPKVKYLSYGGKTYHNECFACVECKKTLAGKRFYALETGNTCEDCYGGAQKITISDYNSD